MKGFYSFVGAHKASDLLFLIVLVIALIAGLAWAKNDQAQAQPTVRVSLVNTNVPSALLLNGIDEHCRGVTLTLDTKNADYALEAQQQVEPASGNWAYALFSKNGDAVYHTVTAKAGNAMKDVCNFLKVGK